MNTKDAILAYIAGHGIATPVTWSGTQKELSTQTWEPDLFYYCRTLDPEKITVVPTGDDLQHGLAAAADHDRRWAVQPLYNFDLSGAALLTSGETYVESVWGSPLVLLREGVVAYREARSRSAELFDSLCPQDFQLKFARGVPQETPLPEHHDAIRSLTRQRIWSTFEQLRIRSVFGVFEWGTTARHALILDWKPPIDQKQTDRLRDILTRPPMPDLVADFDRPALTAVPTSPAGGRLVFDHGARLSHVVTRAVESGPVDVFFRS